MSIDVVRQTLSLPGVACTMRVGNGALESLGGDLRISVGKPRIACLISEAACNSEALDTVTKQLQHNDFYVHTLELPEDGLLSLEAAQKIWDFFITAGATADDAVVALGRSPLLSLVSFAVKCWRNSPVLAMVATDALAAIEAPITPRDISFGTRKTALGTIAYPHMLYADMDYLELDSPSSELACAYMVAGAICEGEEACARLGERAEGLRESDELAWSEQILDSARSRARLISAVAVAVRQSISYAEPFAAALQSQLSSISQAQALGEGYRFLSRLSAGIGEADIDLVLLQDALLDELGIAQVTDEVDPQKLIADMKAYCFERSNRFMMALPMALGRVRHTAVADELLQEHAEAWVRARRAIQELAKGE